MEFSSLRCADVVIAAPSGRIDHPNAHLLQKALAPLLDESAATFGALLLDFAAVEYISSMGLRVLMVAAKQLRGWNRRIAVAALQPVVKETFEISRFNNVIEVFPTVRAALAELSAPALAAFDRAGKPSAA